MNYEIKSNTLTVTVSDKGAELRSVKGADGHEYIWCADERYWRDSAPVLFPICGRILDNKYTADGKEYAMKSHGFAKKCVFEVVEKSESGVKMRLVPNEVTRAEYPFDFELTANFTVKDNILEVSFTVKNTGDAILPYMLGWHPGFTLEGDGAIGNFALDFEGKDSLTWYPLQNGPFVRPYGEEYAIENQRYALNEEEIYANDTMIFVGTGDKTRLSSPEAKHSLDFSWSKNLPYFCIWKDDNSEARFICLEPWSNVPSGGDAPENFDTRKMSRLGTGESETYSYNVKFF